MFTQLRFGLRVLAAGSSGGSAAGHSTTAPFRTSGPHWLDVVPDLACKDSTRQHGLDGLQLSCKRQGGVRVPPPAHNTAGEKHAFAAGASWPSWSGDDPWVVGADADGLPAGAVRLLTSAGGVPVAPAADTLDHASTVSDDPQPRPARRNLLSALHLAEGDEQRTEVGGVGRAARAADRHGRRWLGCQAGDGLSQRPAAFAGGSGPGLTRGVSLHRPGSHHQPAAGSSRIANHRPSTLPARPATSGRPYHSGVHRAGNGQVGASQRDGDGRRIRSCVGCALIIPMIVQTIRLDPSGPVWTDEASDVSRLDPSGAVQIDAEHPARNRTLGKWSGRAGWCASRD